MVAYLTDVKEAADYIEEVDVGLSKKLILYWKLKNLPSNYDTIKQVISNEKSLPLYIEVKLRLLNQQMSKNNKKSKEELKVLAFTY